MTPNTWSEADSRRTRRRYSEEEKAQLLALFAKSGESAAEFCREREIYPATFSVWRKQHRAGGSGSSENTVAFAEVRVATIPVGVVTIALPSGLELRLPAGADPAWVGQLVQELS